MEDEKETLEQTSDAENVDTLTTEEKEEGIELTDTTETAESDDVDDATSNDERTEEEKKEVKKSLKELLEEDKDYQEQFNTMIKNRLDRKDREYQKTLSKYRDTDNVLRTTLKLNDGDDTNTKLREFYEAEGIKLPERLQTDFSDEDYNDLGINDAEKIYSLGFDYAEEEANRLAKIGYANLNTRERACFTKLAETLTEEKNKRELLKLGAKEELLTNKGFVSFKKQFNSNVPMETIYSLYTKSQPQKKVELPGSMKNSKGSTDKDFISEAEYEKMSREEVRKNLDLIEKSMPKW